MNWSSTQGGALHSIGHKSHLDITLDLLSITDDLCTVCYMWFNSIV